MNEAMQLSKGEQTRARLLDAAELLFAQKGFAGTSLRDVASAAGIREPGIYNYFRGKEALYQAVLERGLSPMAAAIEDVLEEGVSDAEMLRIGDVMTDLLAEHPSMAALFQQALASQGDEPAQQLMGDWLARLFEQGIKLSGGGDSETGSSAQSAVRLIALFNLTTGYFLSQPIMEQVGAGDLMSEENLQEQKRLVKKIIRLFLLEN